MIRTARLVATVATAVLSLASTAHAQLLSTGAGTSDTYRGPQSGPGQRVAVSTETNLTSFGFWLGAQQGVTLKYFITDGATNDILFTQTQTYANGIATGTLTLTDPFSFTLNAGQTYGFNVIGDGNYTVSFFSGLTNTSSNGLATSGYNSNFGPYSAPTFQGDAGATIALELNGTQGITATPEPATLALMGTGLLAMGVAARRRRRV